MTLMNLHLDPDTLSLTMSFVLFAFIAYIAFRAVYYAERIKRKEAEARTVFVEKKSDKKSYRQRILHVQKIMAVKFNTLNRRYKQRVTHTAFFYT
jgi:hypothetical protein